MRSLSAEVLSEASQRLFFWLTVSGALGLTILATREANAGLVAHLESHFGGRLG